jgi:hypothetical protein
MTRIGTPPETAGMHHREGSGFELGLPMRVLGRDASGHDFEEQTVLETMSPAEAVFELLSPIDRGTNLKLIVRLPRKLSDTGELNLVIRGRVVFLSSPGQGRSGQRVSLKLESRYVIKPQAEDGAT